MDWQLLLFISAAYVLGSIPFGLLACRLCRAPDPRKAGSGNIGFTNVLRVSGKTAGFLTLLGDLGKGVAVGWLAHRFVSQESWALTISFAVIGGHMFSIFLYFKGGKGVATALGVILGLDGALGLTLVGIWVMTVWLFKYSSGGALMAFGLFPGIVLLTSQSLDFLIFAILVTICIFWRHHSNIMRLIRGTESKVSNISS